MRLTVAQALARFLANQYTERDGVEQRLIAGCFGIFGHGNVAGFGQALLESELEDPQLLPYVLARNEQGMVHAAAAFARQRNRLSTFACSTSVGPGATNMVTGAALATINRLPVLLLPADTFATRAASPVLQELEDPASYDVPVNDCFRPVSAFFDRINRPEQLPSSVLAAMRVLTDPAQTGAETLALPQDVQAEAHDWPEELFAKRVWRVRRPVPEPEVLAEAAALLRSAQRPLIVSGGGTIYAEATEALRELAEASGIPVAETQAGKGSLDHDHPSSVGAVGATGTTAANALARDADVVLGVAVADHHEHLALGIGQLDPEAAGDLVAHARVAVLDVVALGVMRGSSSTSCSSRITGSLRSARCPSRSGRSGSALPIGRAIPTPAGSTATSCRSTWR